VRVLLVSQMYPGPEDPDLGVFVQQIERALVERGHEIERAVLDSRAGGKARYAALARRARVAAQSFRPDVVYAHFLVPTGLAATLASDAPLVVTAHGQDVRNIGTIPGIRLATQRVVRRARTVVCVSGYLRRELETKVPEARGKCVVVDSGVDLERFRPQPAPNGPTAYLAVGGLTDRKNVLRLADAFERLPGNGATLTFLGEGPLRPRLEGRPGVVLAGTVHHDEVPEWIARAHVVCQPSLIEPFGQAILEAMACGRAVVATRVGGPSELVPPDAGVLVDPTDVTELADGLRLAAAFPVPNEAAIEAAAAHDVRLQAERIEAILEQAVRVP
jgi:glycosyltransferase involved in cell wall biosynthesis